MTLDELKAYKEAYMSFNDPTEYQFAVANLTWEIWEEACSDVVLKPVIELWRRELEAKIKSISLSRIMETARGETRDAIQANKLLLDSPWIKEESKRGRPSRTDVLNEANKIATNEQRIADDYQRIVGK